MSFERRQKLVIITVESFGVLGREESEFIDQLATSAIGGRNAVGMAKKGICKKRPVLIISVTSQVAISRRVHRYKLALPDRPATKKEEGRGRGAAANGVGLAHRC